MRKSKKEPSPPSAMYKLYLNFEDDVVYLKQIREQIQKQLDKGKLSAGAAEKLRGFVVLTLEVDKVVSAYNAILKEYFNLEKEND